MGGYGYCGEYQVERLWRDAKLLEIGGGTLEVRCEGGTGVVGVPELSLSLSRYQNRSSVLCAYSRWIGMDRHVTVRCSQAHQKNMTRDMSRIDDF